MTKQSLGCLGFFLLVAAGQALSSGTGPSTLKEGDSVPAVILQSQDGASFQMGAFSGRAVVLTFIFSRCAVPTFCPAMSSQFAELQRAMRKEPSLNGKVHLVSISIDPVFDTPDVLRRYAEHFAIDTSDWSFVTGKPEAISGLAASFSVFIDAAADGGIDHTLATALIGPDGKIRKFWRDNRWTSEAVLTELRVALSETRPPHTIQP